MAKSNPDEAFSLARDLSHLRKAAGRSDDQSLRRFVYVKVHFNTPERWRNSLGERFWVKRQWNAYDRSPAQTSSVKQTRQKYLTKLLGRIRYHYIPAIKSRRTFENLLEEVYQVLAEDDNFIRSMQGFSDQIRSTTEALSTELASQLGGGGPPPPPM